MASQKAGRGLWQTQHVRVPGKYTGDSCLWSEPLSYKKLITLPRQTPFSHFKALKFPKLPGERFINLHFGMLELMGCPHLKVICWSSHTSKVSAICLRSSADVRASAYQCQEITRTVLKQYSSCPQSCYISDHHNSY